MIERRIEASLVASTPGREHRHFKPNRPKQPAERSVQLVTDTTAAGLNDLVNHLLFVEDYPPAEVIVEIFKRYREQMRLVKLAQGLRVRFARASVGDS